MKKEFLLRPDLLAYSKFVQCGISYICGQLEITSNCSQRCIYCDSWRSHAKGTIK